MVLVSVSSLISMRPSNVIFRFHIIRIFKSSQATIAFSFKLSNYSVYCDTDLYESEQTKKLRTNERIAKASQIDMI